MSPFLYFQTSGDGSCMFHAIRDQLAVDELEGDFSTLDLRRNLAVLMAQYWKDIFNFEGMLAVREIYGDPTTEAIPGPFSVAQYLVAMLNSNFWGDSVILFGLAKIWNLRVTVLNGKVLSTTCIRHREGLKRCDVVLVHNGTDHFNGTCKYYSHWHGCLPFQHDGYGFGTIVTK